jgi:predicted nucleic acid-binding Zn ribbon protein
MRQGLSTSEAGKLGAIKSAKTAAIRKQKRIEDWNNNPKLCNFCGIHISYEKRRNNFCSQSCGAAFNNKGVRRHGETPNTCIKCGKQTYNDKFCTRECMQVFNWDKTKTDLLKEGIDHSDANTIGKRYLIELHQGKCQICNLSEWMNQPIPLVLDHINGNPYDNSLTNLRVICHNCNAQTPTFAGRNKGNGRIERAKRWHLEKEILKQVKLM